MKKCKRCGREMDEKSGDFCDECLSAFLFADSEEEKNSFLSDLPNSDENQPPQPKVKVGDSHTKGSQLEENSQAESSLRYIPTWILINCVLNPLAGWIFEAAYIVRGEENKAEKILTVQAIVGIIVLLIILLVACNEGWIA